MWELIRANQRRSAMLVVIMAVLLFVVGYAAAEIAVGPGAGPIGLLIAFAIWTTLSLVGFFQGKTLFMQVAGAHKISKEDHPRLFNIVEEMKIAAQLPAMPDIYIIDDPSPNAFATGRKPEVSAVAVTTGLLAKLNRDELQGVIAHELGHIKNRDVLFMTMIGVMLGAIVLIAELTTRFLFYGGMRRRTSNGGGQAQIFIVLIGLVLIILAPILARIIYLAVSRKREYLADASAAIYTRYPEGLAGALEKISGSKEKMKRTDKVTAPMYIINPLQKLSATGLFATHPPIDKRIKILRGIGNGAGFAQYDEMYRSVSGSNSSIIPASALAEQPAVAPPSPTTGTGAVPLAAAAVAAAAGISAPATAPEADTKINRSRDATNAIWRSRNYRFITCPCGVTLKIPPDYTKADAFCLRCKRLHRVASA
jgi:heat shock protein HtpX